MTQRQFIRILKTDVDKAPSRWRAAERLNISGASLSRIMAGKQEPSSALLKRYGLVRQIVYVNAPLPVKRKIVYVSDSEREITTPRNGNSDSGDVKQP